MQTKHNKTPIHKQQTMVLLCTISLHRFLMTEQLIRLVTNSYFVCSSMYSLHEHYIIKKGFIEF
jgi:hypothetical protein